MSFGELFFYRTQTWNEWKKSQLRNQESAKADSTQSNKKKAHIPKEPRPKTYVATL